MYVNYNGEVLRENTVSVSPNNRAFRYADGFFETMRIIDGKISLQHYHLERLYTTLDLFKFPASLFPTSTSLADEIIDIAKRNGHNLSARVRLTIFGGEGAINDHSPRKANYLIQTYLLSTDGYKLNDKGFVIDFFKDGVKPCDNFSSSKTNNCLPYVMASIWANEKQLDDAILLNPYGNIADATIANIFIIKDGSIKTPRLKDGAVNGVMRRYLIKCFKNNAIPFEETSVTVEDILQASEVFLTNAIFGIKWVERVNASFYTCNMSSFLYNKFLSNPSSLFNNL